MRKIKTLLKISINSMLLLLLGSFVALPAVSMGMFSIDQTASSVLSSSSARESTPVVTEQKHVYKPEITNLQEELPLIPAVLETTEASSATN